MIPSGDVVPNRWFVGLSRVVNSCLLWVWDVRNFKATTGRTFALIDSGLSEPQGLALDHDRGASLG